MSTGGAARQQGGPDGVLPWPRRFSLPPASGLAACRSAIGPVFDLAVPPAEIQEFQGNIRFAATRRILLSRIACSSARFRRSADTMAHCRTDHFCLWLVNHGGLTGHVPRRAVEAAASDVLVLDLQQALDLQASPQGGLTESFGLWLPRHRLLSAIAREDALHGLVVKGGTATGHLLGASLLALGGALLPEAQAMSAAELDVLASGVIDLAAQALRATLAAGGAGAAAAPLDSFVIIRRFIDANIPLPELGVDMLAEKFGVSRSSLYRLFEPVGGIAAYIKQQRLQRAYLQITAPGGANHRLGQISYRLGFRDFSAFCRMFRAHFGVSPREARKAALAGAMVQATTAGREDETLSGWLAETV